MSFTRVFFFLLVITVSLPAQFVARDPGVRGGSAGAGKAISGLLGFEKIFFSAGADDFQEVQSVLGKAAGASGVGLGPRFNLDSCAACHAQLSRLNRGPSPTPDAP